jgi:hypothetical protein
VIGTGTASNLISTNLPFTVRRASAPLRKPPRALEAPQLPARSFCRRATASTLSTARVR